MKNEFELRIYLDHLLIQHQVKLSDHVDRVLRHHNISHFQISCLMELMHWQF